MSGKCRPRVKLEAKIFSFVECAARFFEAGLGRATGAGGCSVHTPRGRRTRSLYSWRKLWYCTLDDNPPVCGLRRPPAPPRSATPRGPTPTIQWPSLLGLDQGRRDDLGRRAGLFCMLLTISQGLGPLGEKEVLDDDCACWQALGDSRLVDV